MAIVCSQMKRRPPWSLKIQQHLDHVIFVAEQILMKFPSVLRNLVLSSGAIFHTTTIELERGEVCHGIFEAGRGSAPVAEAAATDQWLEVPRKAIAVPDEKGKYNIQVDVEVKK